MTMNELRSLEDIKRATRKPGGASHWFSPETMRFFKSRVSETVYPVASTGGAFFVTSEKRDEDSPRLYSVRYASRDGRITTIDGFQAYRSANGAHYRAALLRGLLASGGMTEPGGEA